VGELVTAGGEPAQLLRSIKTAAAYKSGRIFLLAPEIFDIT
jgi:hypothetical protein